MKILICGATGLIGQALVQSMHDKQYNLTIISRDLNKSKKKFPQLPVFTWSHLIEDEEFINQFDSVINLAGENIGNQRWTVNRKQALLKSRVFTTRCIAEACAKNPQKAPRILNASAIGIYGITSDINHQNRNYYSEASMINAKPNDFLAEIGVKWEAALRPAQTVGIPVVKMRFAVVLAKNGGALAKLLPVYKLGLGGKVGSGKQPFSWISLTDVVRAINYLIEHPQINGAVNIVAPEVVSQKVFSQTLARVLKRPAIFSIPASMIKFFFGEMGIALLLNGQWVKNEVLANSTFKYTHLTLRVALQDELCR